MNKSGPFNAGMKHILHLHYLIIFCTIVFYWVWKNAVVKYPNSLFVQDVIEKVYDKIQWKYLFSNVHINSI